MGKKEKKGKTTKINDRLENRVHKITLLSLCMIKLNL